MGTSQNLSNFACNTLSNTVRLSLFETFAVTNLQSLERRSKVFMSQFYFK